MSLLSFVCFFFFNDTATTEIYTLSLHDALPIYRPVVHGRDVFQLGEPGTALDRVAPGRAVAGGAAVVDVHDGEAGVQPERDRKSTRLNSSHANISYAVFCLKKKKNNLQYILIRR